MYTRRSQHAIHTRHKKHQYIRRRREIDIKIYIDSEFIDDGSIVDLISIGLVAEDGRELYLQSVEFNEQNVSPWVQDNVIAHLLACPHHKTKEQLTRHRPHGQCTFEKPARGITGLCMPKMSGFIIGAHADCPWRTCAQIAQELDVFLNPETHGTPELIGWCAGYDWVALCQLYGTMMDIPSGWPHYVKDLQFILDERGITDDMLPQQETELHNALADAKHIQRLWNTYYSGER